MANALEPVAADPGMTAPAIADPGEESLIILQSLLCLLREKNLLTRRDIEELCHKVEQRAAGQLDLPLPCCKESASAASADMRRVTRFIGQRYGGRLGPGY